MSREKNPQPSPCEHGRRYWRRYVRVRPALSIALLTVVAGCSTGPDDVGSAPGGGDTSPLYAAVTLVWSEEGPTGYVSISDTLDIQRVSLESAREFPGYTSVAVADGQLLVNPGWEDLTIERYRVAGGSHWVENGTLSFANEGVEAVSFHTQYLRQDHAAYLDVDVTGRVVWDPIDLVIMGARADDVLDPQRDGLDLFANWNRTQFVFGDAIVRPFSYHDQDWFRWSADSELVVYDGTTHEPSEVVTAPCPGLDSITRDEAGNTYLSSWEYSALHPLMGTGAAPCAVKLEPDNGLDPSWNSDLTMMTQGRHVVNFRYVGKGKAIAAVLHSEEYGQGFGFARLAEDVDDFWATAARFHRLWVFDLQEQSAAPVTGIDDFEFVNPGFFHATLDGRTFVFLGDGNNGSNNVNQTVVYELDDHGHATRRFDVLGNVTQWVRVR
jgi:hypothetical protein